MFSHPFLRRPLLALLGLLVLLTASAAQIPSPVSRPAENSGNKPSAGEVEIKAVKYPELCAAVRAQRGKVVVVDVWAEY